MILCRVILIFDLKINLFPGFTVDHVYVKLVILAAAIFWDIVWKIKPKNWQTDKRINATDHTTHVTTIIDGN